MLACTLEDIQLDNECELAIREDAAPQQCVDCGAWTYADRCPLCPGRPLVNSLERKIDALAKGKVSFEELEAMVLGKRKGSA